MYDTTIISTGITGIAIARELSKYISDKLNLNDGFARFLFSKLLHLIEKLALFFIKN